MNKRLETTEDLLDFSMERLIECLEILSVKNADYAGDDGVFANFEATTAMGIDPLLGLLIRSLDKLRRIKTFADKGELSVENESVDDAFNDLINYMLIGKGMIHNRRLLD